MKLPAILGGTPKFDNNNPLKLTKPKIYDREKIYSKIKDIFDSGNLTDSRYVRILEEKLKDKINVKHAICVSNCTLGLILSLKALQIKGKVLVPSFTFIATINAIIWNNLIPKFIDIDEETLTIDPKSVIKNIDSDTSCILGVYTFGTPPFIDNLEIIRKEYGSRFLLDSAHALGSIHNFKKAGSFADFEVFSLSPTKPIVAGEGGVITTNNDELAEKIKILKNYGHNGNYNSILNGLNARMSEMHAVIALSNFEHLEEEIEHRNELAKKYRRVLSQISGVRFPKIPENCISTFKDFAIIIDEEEFGLSRDFLRKSLSVENIETKTYFDPPCHKQTLFKKFHNNSRDLPITEKISKSILILPFFSEMKEEEILKVHEAINEIKMHSNSIKSLCLKKQTFSNILNIF
jgi:dTDP-4-amino-4,6-dideoxygalactose transaminase